MSELREYIQHKYNCNISSYGEEVMDDGIAVPCSCGLAQALEAPSEMQQLEEWLEHERGYFDKGGARMFYDHVLDHIRTEFKEGDEGGMEWGDIKDHTDRDEGR